jgi:hypothetical protein
MFPDFGENNLPVPLLIFALVLVQMQILNRVIANLQIT